MMVDLTILNNTLWLLVLVDLSDLSLWMVMRRVISCCKSDVNIGSMHSLTSSEVMHQVKTSWCIVINYIETYVSCKNATKTAVQRKIEALR